MCGMGPTVAKRSTPPMDEIAAHVDERCGGSLSCRVKCESIEGFPGIIVSNSELSSTGSARCRLSLSVFLVRP